MAGYGPGGKAHRILERLADGDASFTDLAEAMGLPTRNSKQTQLWHLIGAMLADRLIGGVRKNYWLTPTGNDALSALRAGQEAKVSRTSVRVFA